MHPSQRSSLRGEDGQANLYLLIGLTLALLAIMLLFVRVGNANDLRSQAQTAADSAALAAAGIARDNAAQSLVEGDIPYSGLYEPAEGKSTAKAYAKNNGAVLESIRASDDSQGNLGNIVRVEVRTTKCQSELQQDRSRGWGDTECDSPESDASNTGNAAAIAKVVMPDCEYQIGSSEIFGVICEGTPIQSFTQAQQIIQLN